ncbi:hypothetical protein YC2023_061666 [Brassica napus]
MVSLHLPLFLLLYILLSFLCKNQTPKNTQTSIYGDDTKWEVNCLLRIRRQSHVLQRYLSPRISVAVSAPPFLGGLEPNKEDVYWPRDAAHQRTGNSYSRIHLPRTYSNIFELNNFYGSRNKTVFRVSDHTATVSFTWNSELSVLQDGHAPFDEDSFWFHSYEEFQASCDLKGDLYDVVGHMKLVNGQSTKEAPVLDEVEIAKSRRVLIHIQSHDVPMMKLYLWDQAARDFCKKFKSYEKTPTVLLVTTVNAKTLGGTLALASMSTLP